MSFAETETLRDPTRPLGHSGVGVAQDDAPLRLQSILVSDSRKVAYINGQQLREQNVIAGSAGIKVIRIEAGSVTLQQGEKRWKLNLNNVTVRK
jgi:hypothetical protein